jgi:arginyl-tRNA synthetase
MTTYARELSQAFSAFYRDQKVVGTPEEPFRLALSMQTQRVIARSLDLLGVSAPEEM